MVLFYAIILACSLSSDRLGWESEAVMNSLSVEKGGYHEKKKQTI